MAEMKILMVEDEKIVGKDLQACLTGLGYAVPEVVDTAEAALERAAELRPDLVLMDIMLKGGGNGIDAAARIRETLDIPVIFLTAYSDDAILERAKTVQPFGFIIKPYQERELASAIEMALYKSRMERQVRHLNEVLLAVRNVNQLIVQEKDRGRLLQGACDLLVETRGYHHAWIVLVDGNRRATEAVGAGLEPEMGRIVSSANPAEILLCINRTLDRSGAALVEDPDTVCRDCPLSGLAADRLDMVAGLTHEGKAYGVLGVSLAREAAEVEEERDLFEEVAGDIAYALHNLELEEERQRLSATLKESEEQFRLISDESLTGIFMHQDGTLIYVNPCLARILGYDPAEPQAYLGQPFLDFVHPEERETAARNAGRRLKDEDAPSQFFTRLIDVNGATVWVEVMVKLIELGGQSVLMGNILDITRHIAAEKEKEKLEEQLRQAMKMEAIGRLAGGIAHDFNNILTGIIGYAELVQSKISPHDPILPDLNEIQQAGERAAALTHQLLAFSRKQIIAPRVIDLNKVIDRANRMIGRIIGEDIELNFVPLDALWPVRMDPTQVDQILINLATNSRDAMPSGGKLTIETSNVSLDADSGRHLDEELPPGDYTMLAVSDNGSGMDADTQSKIFEPFFSTKEKDQGTGLGLSTVYGIVKQSDGYISVNSEIDSGTTFRIYFPREKAEAEPVLESAVTEQPRGSETVLLVEDEDLVRTLSVRILERQGYRVITAIDGEEAIKLCRNVQGMVDLLLTDVIMPRMNGRELFNALREQQPKLKVLYMSGYTDDVVARHGILEQGTNFLAKPFTIREIARAVRRALDKD